MLKASYESLLTGNETSFIIRRFEENAFTAPYHFHPELELTLILQGEGKRFVGSNMAAYTAGDLVLLGQNLPHCWKSEKTRNKQINASSLVIQFTADFLGAGFFDKPELHRILSLIQRSQHGVQFLKHSAVEAGDQLLELEKETNTFKKLIMLLEILDHLANTRHFTLLSKNEQSFVYSEREKKRINDVIAYVVDNFRNDIRLETAARIAQMTPAGFCKFFKRMTRKTFIETVMDYRIDYATQQLVHTDKPVSHISFDCGFGDVSHFYKTFRKKKKWSPLHYRKKFSADLG